MTRRRRRALGSVVAAIAVAATTLIATSKADVLHVPTSATTSTAADATTGASTRGSSWASTRAGTPAAARQSAAALAALPVKGRAPMTTYSRAQFGQAWSDDVSVADGHNGCDQRSDVLRQNMTDVTIKPGTHGCIPATGTLADPYSGTTLHYVRGARPVVISMDHIVALADAWQKGAQQWSANKRRDFAGDPANLQAVSASLNSKKRDGDIATWTPPNRAYWCTYAQRQIAVKTTYGVWVTAAEKQALQRALSTCT